MVTATVQSGAAVEQLAVSAYEVPTDVPESDGTLAWNTTTLVLVEAEAGGERGLGFTYCDVAAGRLIESMLGGEVEGCDALSPPAAWARMQLLVRNVGRPGIAACAIAAVDVALWDLKAKLLGLALADALPRFHETVPVYGSGGFTSYSEERLMKQVSGWAEEGIGAVKIKVGRDPAADLDRVAVARGVWEIIMPSHHMCRVSSPNSHMQSESPLSGGNGAVRTPQCLPRRLASNLAAP